jgi:hypothetical protein
VSAIKKLRELANKIDWYIADNYGIPYDLRKIANEMEAENDKLKELCASMWKAIPKSESCEWDFEANCCTGDCNGECGYWYRMRDLGIEVE